LEIDIQSDEKQVRERAGYYLNSSFSTKSWTRKEDLLIIELIKSNETNCSFNN
jgi:hypothetical protein